MYTREDLVLARRKVTIEKCPHRQIARRCICTLTERTARRDESGPEKRCRDPIPSTEYRDKRGKPDADECGRRNGGRQKDTGNQAGTKS